MGGLPACIAAQTHSLDQVLEKSPTRVQNFPARVSRADQNSKCPSPEPETVDGAVNLSNCCLDVCSAVLRPLRRRGGWSVDIGKASSLAEAMLPFASPMGKMWLARLTPPGRRFNEEASSGSWVSGSANIPRLGPYSTIWTTFPDLDMEFDAFATTYPRGMSSPGPRFS